MFSQSSYLKLKKLFRRAIIKIPPKYRSEFENTSTYLNLVRIRVILITALFFTMLIILSKAIILASPGEQPIIRNLILLNLIHLVITFILFHLISRMIPASSNDIRPLHLVLQYCIILYVLLYYAFYSALLDWSIHSAAGYIISSIAMSSYIILKNRPVILLLMANSSLFVLTLSVLNKGQIHFLEKYFYIVPLMIIAWVTSRIGYLFQYSGFIKNKRFMQINLRLAQEVDKKRRTEESLREIQDELENRVRLRTEALNKMNIKLQDEIREHQKDQRIKQELEEKLIRSEKMEVIGKLAGGVAHDLNNLLSAIINYPELLLMKMPKSSPYRSKLEIMKSSGQKAAAIVKDLLTLARRGSIQKEPVSLNDIVTRYLLSPEYERLRSYHPNIKLSNHLSDTVSNIEGSAVHLEKTVMNLVSNATEAMDNGGTITLSTGNRYIEKPVPSYDQTIKAGHYVFLKVSDQGSGIEAEELKRIFEPFFTKKVMGRSGTGLGLTVVWNTIKDHDGYILIDSTPGFGTEFELVFPASDGELSHVEELVNIESYIGNDEKLLIVDDVYEQREIANSLLSLLGYSVQTVASGEAAIEYLRKNQVDLVLLDMIMDPGIDGFQTYKKIRKIDPNIKTVIVSGFSETDRVRDTISLGALQYIQKPYTLEKIGNVVKEVLTESSPGPG